MSTTVSEIRTRLRVLAKDRGYAMEYDVVKGIMELLKQAEEKKQARFGCGVRLVGAEVGPPPNQDLQPAHIVTCIQQHGFVGPQVKPSLLEVLLSMTPVPAALGLWHALVRGLSTLWIQLLQVDRQIPLETLGVELLPME